MSSLIVSAADAPAAIPLFAVREVELASALEVLGPLAVNWAEAQGFSAAAGAVLQVPGADGKLAAVLFGLGGEAPAAPFLLGKLIGAVPAGDYRIEAFSGDLELGLLGYLLSAYSFDRYRKDAPERPRLVVPATVDRARLERIAAAVTLARDLVNTPANDMTPAELARIAVEVAEVNRAHVTVTLGDELKMRGLNLIYGVGQAAHQAPRLVDFTWGPTDAPKVTLVGKGVTFDSGGLDLKTSAGMLLMKKDMGGAANALALAKLIMESGLKVRLRVLLPIVENAVSAPSFRPGDILTSRKGLTVEIGNTDAEGRLILADALNLADEDAPDLLVDFATLTGAARVALGPDLPPVYTDDDTLYGELYAASVEVNDPLWRMPLWPGYAEVMKSKIADLSNSGNFSGFAGSITAALFLKNFVDKAASWLHCDIYAWTPAAKPGKTEGGEAQVIRALFAVLEKRYG